MKLLDCTLRDGGYYNAWDFSTDLINQYLVSMKAAKVDIVELGFRFLKNSGFKGACAYTTDEFIESLDIPAGLTIGVMVNGADLVTEIGVEPALEKLFPRKASETPVDIVRFACHFHEFEKVLPAAKWLSDRGYRVGFNLMQIASRSREEVLDLATKANDWPVEVLYFADSMGSMKPEDAASIVSWIREKWAGPVGIHTHDNMGLALHNTISAQNAGATWFDATVTGMGRGPGNARTEEMVIELPAGDGGHRNLVPLMSLIRQHFGPMKTHYGWGTNPYYFLAGKHGIHPTYIQKMLSDSRFSEEDIFAVIDFLQKEGGEKFSNDVLAGARSFYSGTPKGTWDPKSVISGRDVLILGTGPGVERHKEALEGFIRNSAPVVIALNTQTALSANLIDFRTACHPVRLMADRDAHSELPQPLIIPFSMLPDGVQEALAGKEVFDFGLGVGSGAFAFSETSCQLPRPLVLAYTLAIAASGGANRILMAGFDGYPAGDPRNDETAEVFEAFVAVCDTELLAITPTRHKIESASVYAMA